MPSVHSIPSTTRPTPVPQNTFAFPANKHLLITTPSRILSWDNSGLHTLFTSSKAGIAAATESKDGTGILAIADKHVVVLHDTKRGKEKSWGLNAAEDEVRHLEYTKDSKNLFLSTKVTNAIQCYSTQAEQLLSPPQTLASPPAALAVSPTGHLMISAQGSPPVIFLKDLAKNSTATMMKPQASFSEIATIAFHPEKANVFLLAFDDGTLAVYDASRLPRTEGKYVNQNSMAKGDRGWIRQLHRTVPTKDGAKPRSITGAAFIPGQKLKVVTVGNDGRCNLVDFSNGAAVLRTWHGQAPLTSVSVLAPSRTAPLPSASRKGKAPAKGVEIGSIIAVGSQDGNVLLYDLLGLLQSHQDTSATGERILSVEWINSVSPTVLPQKSHPNSDGLPQTTPAKHSVSQPSVVHDSTATPKHLSIHPALRPPTLPPNLSSPQPSRKFTTHPDELIEDSTVRHTPKAGGDHMISAEAGAYLDLFSPVNPFKVEQSRVNRDSSFSPTRVRPRISSQTFSKEGRISRGMASSSQTPRLLPTNHSHATSSESMPLHIRGRHSAQPKLCHPASRGSPLKTERRKHYPSSVRKMNQGRNGSAETVDATVAANAKLLRDLRQMNASSATTHAGSVLQGYASRGQGFKRPAKPPQATAALEAPQSASNPTEKPVETHVYGRDGRWPTETVDNSLWGEEDDIWLTSDEERKRNSSRRTQRFARPVARQTSRSRVDSLGTFSTTHAGAEVPAANAGTPPAPMVTKGITSTEDYTTAHSHLSPDGAFNLAPEDVESLFPRTSSKSPKRGKQDIDRRSRQSPRHRKTALQDIASNSAAGRRPSNPWTRVKEAKSLPLESARDADLAGSTADDRVAPPDARGAACGGCAGNAAKVKVLEGEMAHMKGEILALRAMLRRNGIPTPAIPTR